MSKSLFGGRYFSVFSCKMCKKSSHSMASLVHIMLPSCRPVTEYIASSPFVTKIVGSLYGRGYAIRQSHVGSVGERAGAAVSSCILGQ